jgi:myo-inositol-1(or 4)-monophosphatase
MLHNVPAPDLVDRSAELREAVTAAARRTAEYAGSVARTAPVREYKTSAHDIVTVHDREAERIAVAELLAAVPGARVIGEEGGAQGGDGPVTFYVDPIDGTSNFAAGLPQFCVSIGAVIDDEPVAGAIVAPLLGDEFTADLTGAWHNGAPMRSATQPDEADALVLTGFPSLRDLHRDEQRALSEYARLLRGVGSVRSLGSGALQLAYVAAGWADATFGTRTNSWDIAAGVLLVEQSGGRVVHYPDASRPRLHQPGYLAVGAGAGVPLVERLMAEQEIGERGAQAVRGSR